MSTFMHNLIERDYQNRRIGIIENGSWAPTAARIIKKTFENSKNITFCENIVNIRSALNDTNNAQIDALAEEIAESYK